MAEVRIVLRVARVCGSAPRCERYAVDGEMEPQRGPVRVMGIICD